MEEFSVKDLIITEITVSTACMFNKNWHSMLPDIVESNIVRNKHHICFGAYFDHKCYAVAIWSSPVADNRFKKKNDWLELRRYAISPDAPYNTASRMLSIMRKYINKSFPTVEKLISYQDTDVHCGTIYKTSGWKPFITKTSQDWSETRKRKNDSTRKNKIRWEIDLKTHEKDYSLLNK